jgi:hypothetical protein
MATDTDRDRGPANDNGDHDREGKAIAPAPAPTAGTLATVSLAALTTVFAKVSTSSIVGRSGFPMMLFKARTNDGTWMYGRKQIVPEEGGLWVVDIASFRYGWVCFNAGNDNKPEELMVSVSKPMPVRPDHDWQQQWTVQLKCCSGADAGVQVEYKATNQGCLDAIGGLFETIRERLIAGQHGGNACPVLVLEHSHYMHPQYGRTGIPVMRIVDWVPVEGPQPAPSPTPPPANNNSNQPPRRRRVA